MLISDVSFFFNLSSCCVYQMKALQGIKNSYRLQQVLNKNNPLEPIRGFRQSDEGQFQALNGFLYTVLRANRSHRRGLLTSLLNLFDDTGVGTA